MINFLIVLIAGALLPLAFAPHNIYPLAYLCPAALLFCWLKARPMQAFWQGLVFGLAFFGVGSSWIYISIHLFGNATAFLAGLITFLFVALMSTYAATQGLVLRLLFKNKPAWVTCLCAFPATWVLWEWIRSFLYDGFSFLFLGYTQFPTPLNALAPVFGTYGISLAVTLISGAIIVILTQNTLRIKTIAAVILIIVFGLGIGFQATHWTAPEGKPLTVSLIQGNIPQSMKWQPQEVMTIINKYQRLTEQHWSSNLIIWPEAAVPFYPDELPLFFSKLNDQAIQHNTYLIFGAPLKNRRTGNYYNGLLMLGAGQGQYLKRRLVPYGEFIPLQSSLGRLMDYFKIPRASTTPGPANQPPVVVNHIPIATFICYESAFPIEGLNAIENTGLIINISDDAWFGKSWALDQQLQMTQMRALETGRYAVTATNTGITAIISPMGDIIKQVPIDQTAVLTGDVFMMHGKTPLMRWRYYPVFTLIFVLLLIAFWSKATIVQKHKP